MQRWRTECGEQHAVVAVDNLLPARTLLDVCRKKMSIAIKHNTEAGDCIRYLNVNISQSNRMDVELDQMQGRTQPDKLSFIHVNLETVGEHPGTNVIDTRSDDW